MEIFQVAILKNMKYIDIHTHKLKGDGNIQILNVFAQDLVNFYPEFLFSTGIHPWHIEKVSLEDCCHSIEQVILMKNMLAVGECGLDRSIAIDFALQEKYFRNQIKIANKHSKPLIIHCVRAQSELIKLKKETKSTVPWILHGYQGNQQTTKNLIDHGFYFSVGKPLLNMISKHDVFKSIPPERLFLETDNLETSIEKIYSLAAEILNIDEELISEAIFKNFKTIFGADQTKFIV